MRNILLIAKREYLEQIRSRAFKFSTVGLPLVFAAMLGFMYLSANGLGEHRHLAIASDNAALANDLRTRLLSDEERQSRARRGSAGQAGGPCGPGGYRFSTKAIDGLLWIDTPAGAAPSATYISQSAGL